MDKTESVRVAVNVRPLVTSELLVGCSDCINVTPDRPQVQIGSHSFTFDYVYASSDSSRIFDDCVAPLVDALFSGYNATVLAYGQTGSGKTYVMGTNYSGESTNGIIPKVMQKIFTHVEDTKGNTEYLIRVSFIEIYKDEVIDLLISSGNTVYSRADGNGKGTGPSRAPIQIQEIANGGISLAGVTEAEVTSQEEMASFLLRGSVCRVTRRTNMNSQSSRSHAVFTISMEQKQIAGVTSAGGHDDGGVDDILSAKLHLVDLACSEGAKKTGADGMPLREGININMGLLALGNVISALGDDKKQKGGHVPYRDSKLTRLLQDSLGGNSKTVMIACVSPADTNAEETLNTLKYANRARNIQNKPIVNCDPVTAQMQMMKNQIEQLQAELLYVKGNSSTPVEELQEQKIALLETSNMNLHKQLHEYQVNVEHLTKQATDAQFEKDKLLLKIEYALDGKPSDEIDCDSNKILKQKLALLETSNMNLHKQLHEYQVNVEHLTKQATDAQFEKDKLLLKIESAPDGKISDEIDCDSNKDVNVLKSYKSRIYELEGDLLLSKGLNTSKRTEIHYLDLDDNTFHPKSCLFPEPDSKTAEAAENFEVEEKELEHCSLQEKLDNERKELDKRLEQKEAEMKRVAGCDTAVLKQHYEKKVQYLEQEKRNLQVEMKRVAGGDSSVLKQHYEKKVQDLEQEKRNLQKENEQLRCNLANISDDSTQKFQPLFELFEETPYPDKKDLEMLAKELHIHQSRAEGRLGSQSAQQRDARRS